MAYNGLSGTLPDSWGTAGAFPSLGDVYLHRNKLGGTLPAAWAAPGSLPNLRWLSVFDNQLTGTACTVYDKHGSRLEQSPLCWTRCCATQRRVAHSCAGPVL